MLYKNYLIIVALFLAFASDALFAKGAKIALHLKNGRQQRGELYSVSDSSLVVGWQEAGKERFAEFKNHEISHVVVNKKPDLLLLLTNEQQISGKFYAASDSSLFVEIREAAPSRTRSNFGKHIFEVKNREIKLAMVRLKGRSHSLPGAGLGLLAGTVAGSMFATHLLFRDKDDVGDFFEDFFSSGWAIIGGAIGGTIVGGSIGAANSTPAKEVETSVIRAYAVLKPFARYTERQ